MMHNMKLTEQQVRQVAAEAMVDPRTVAKIYGGGRSKAMVRERVCVAAKKLKIQVPPTGEG